MIRLRYKNGKFLDFSDNCIVYSEADEDTGKQKFVCVFEKGKGTAYFFRRSIKGVEFIDDVETI